MENRFDKKFWNNLYEVEDTGWDMGIVSPPLKSYFDKLENKEQHILIPGAGNAHEAEYLHTSGFVNVHVLDVAPQAVTRFKSRVSSFPLDHIHNEDFFAHKGQYDLIIEQTFFCALEPSLRQQYKEQMHALLLPEGKLAGLLFGVELNDDRPPFGGSESEYRNLFSNRFTIIEMGMAKNSHVKRAERELFFELLKK